MSKDKPVKEATYLRVKLQGVMVHWKSLPAHQHTIKHEYLVNIPLRTIDCIILCKYCWTLKLWSEQYLVKKMTEYFRSRWWFNDRIIFEQDSEWSNHARCFLRHRRTGVFCTDGNLLPAILRPYSHQGPQRYVRLYHWWVIRTRGHIVQGFNTSHSD